MQRELFLRIGIVGCLLSVSLINLQAQNTPGSVSPGVGTAKADTLPVLTLPQCIDIALKNNITVRQGQLQVQNSTLLLRQSKYNQLPTVNAFASQGFSAGRNINPSTNQFVDVAVRSNNFQMTGSMPIFQGYQLRNLIRQNGVIVKATEKELDATENTVILSVIQQYLNVLTGAEQLNVARRQAETSQIQVERTQKLVNAGSAPEANLFEIKATLANDELAVVNAQNTVDLAKLALLQAMNLPGGQAFEIEYIKLPDPRVEGYAVSAQQVYESALATQPQIAAADLRTESARVGIDVAKAGLYPRLTLNGNLSSIYSTIGLSRFIADGTTITNSTNANVTVNGVTQPVVISTTQAGGSYQTYGFFEQLSNTLNRGVTLSLNIPIFTNRQYRTNVTSAIINQQNAQLVADNTRLQLRQQIETAYTNLLAASNRYRATDFSVSSLERAFRAAESRFNAGAINAVDYSLAKLRYDNARAQLVQAKYDYVFRTKILDFYQNKPLSFN